MGVAEVPKFKSSYASGEDWERLILQRHLCKCSGQMETVLQKE
jgi:hypothetical protein